jgi:hypothetical protein
MLARVALAATVAVLTSVATNPGELSGDQALAEARAWITAACTHNLDDLRAHTALPFLQKDFVPLNPKREDACEGKFRIDEPSAFEAAAQCMVETDITHEYTIPVALEHLKLIKPRPSAWKPPFREAVVQRMKSDKFVQTKWRAGCEVYKLTLAIRRTDTGAAVSLALLDADLVCE